MSPSDYRQCAEARLRDVARRPPLAPDREIARQIRLVELASRARSGRADRPADHLGPVPLRLARSCRSGRRRTSPNASPNSRSPPWSSTSRSAVAGDRLPDERDQLPLMGRRRGLFPAESGRTSKAGSSASWCAAESWPPEPSSSAGRRRRSSGPSRSSTSPRTTSGAPQSAPPSETSRACTKPMTGSSGLAEPELGGDPSLVDVVGLNFYPHNQWYLRGPDDPDGPSRI